MRRITVQSPTAPFRKIRLLSVVSLIRIFSSVFIWVKIIFIKNSKAICYFAITEQILDEGKRGNEFAEWHVAWLAE